MAVEQIYNWLFINKSNCSNLYKGGENALKAMQKGLKKAVLQCVNCMFCSMGLLYQHRRYFIKKSSYPTEHLEWGPYNVFIFRTPQAPFANELLFAVRDALRNIWNNRRVLPWHVIWLYWL
jgi:hypothetical protein